MLANEIIDIISNAFRTDLILGDGHTLAACDYYDDWRWFPEDGDLKLISGCSWAEPALNKWPEEVKNEILAEIREKKITYKTYTFFDVTYEYLDLFSAGTPYLDQHGFKFYLAAWMINDLRCMIDEESLINLYFFNRLEDYHADNRTYTKIDYTHDQLAAISNHLNFLIGRNGCNYMEAKTCFELGWGEYLDKAAKSK